MPSLQKRIAAAQGKVQCDTLIRGARYLDVFSCEWRSGDIAIFDGVIVGVETGLRAKREINAKGKFLVPGFIDAHVHVESSLLVPANFQNAVLPRGTTTAICDPHELANVAGVRGIEYFLNEASRLAIDLRVMLSSCVPATEFETNGAGIIPAAKLLPLMRHPKSLGLAEMMNVPGLLAGDKLVLDKLDAFADYPIDGHCPTLSGQALSAYASTGISSCHESSTLEEAREKISKGIACWIREGSVAKDLDALIPLLTLATSTSIGFCTDDRNPQDIEDEGHIDHLVRKAIKYGVKPEIVYRTASWSVARHYGLRHLGAIAPGYAADLVVLGDARSCAVQQVFKAGTLSEELVAKAKKIADVKNTVRAKTPSEADLRGPAGRVHVIGVKSGSILTEHHVMNHDAQGVARLTVLERHGKGRKPANAYATGFGRNFKGAIASSVAHDSHNLITVGSNERDMRVALASLIKNGGGFCVVRDGAVQAELALPFGGLMSDRSPQQITASLRNLHAATLGMGCELSEPFLQLAFLSLPVIPSLKLTDKGLVDVEKFRIIDVRA